MDALDNFYTDHPFVDWYKQPKMKDILSIFQKGLFFGLDDYQFWEYRFTQIYCKSLKSLWMARSEMSGHSFLVLIQKLHKFCFENSSRKLLSFNNSANSPVGQARYVASWNFNCVWVVDPTFPLSKSEMLLKLCFSLKLLGVLSKHSANNPGSSNSNLPWGPNETYNVTRGPHYDADATVAVPEPY